MPTSLPPKKEVMLALLEKSSVFIHLDPRSDAVQVPPWLKKQAQLVLQVGLNMAVPIPDLSVDDDAVSCTLSFSRSPHFCYVPWKAIFALVGDDSRGMVWPNDIPPEVVAQGAQKKATSQKPRLKAVQTGPSSRSKTAKDNKTRAAPARSSDAPRPTLSAVASAQEGPSGAEDELDVRTETLTEADATQPGAEGSNPAAATTEADGQSPSSADPPSKSKLPPYLRIVK